MAEADAAVEARKKPPEDAGPKIIGEGLVIDEWVSQSGHSTKAHFVISLSHLMVIYFLMFVEGEKGKISCATAGGRGGLGVRFVYRVI